MAARAPGARLCVTQLWGRTHTRGTAPSPESLLRPRPAFPEPPVLSVGPGPVVNRKQQLRVASDTAVQSDASSMTGNTVSLLGAQSGGPSDVRHRAATRLWEQPGATGGGRLAPGRAVGSREAWLGAAWAGRRAPRWVHAAGRPAAHRAALPTCTCRTGRRPEVPGARGLTTSGQDTFFGDSENVPRWRAVVATQLCSSR